MKTPLLALLGLLLIALLLTVFVFRPYSMGSASEIPSGWGSRMAARYRGQPAWSNPIEGALIPQHPFLARTNANNMHADGYASGVHPRGGPLGRNPQVESYAHSRFGGECASVTFDSRGNIVAVCATLSDFSLLLIRRDDLTPLARMGLPQRESNKSLNLRRIMSDTSGGAYFFLDHKDRAVLVDAEQTLKVIGQQWQDGVPSFTVEQRYDLMPLLLENTDGEDVITAVLPDWRGRYWFVSRSGLIGVLNPNTGNTGAITLKGEEIQNSFAVDNSGVYVVSDYALYGLTAADGNPRPRVVWREEYERGARIKLGPITRGSGTTPTLLGDQYVAIADNAESRIQVLVYRREMAYPGDRQVCKVPVFESGESATENSMIGFGNSLMIENNYGYDLFLNMMFGRTGKGGVTRIDVNQDGAGCSRVWHNPIISQTTVPKLSQEHGLVYTYSKDPSIGWGVDAYYLTALDFETGETIYQALMGTGVSYDNNWAPITVGADACAYVGVLRGLVRMCDGA